MKFLSRGVLLLFIFRPWQAMAQQPIEFPHDRHIVIGLQCVDCHITADTRAEASLPSVRKCMLCHAVFATTKPGVKELRRYAEQKREIPWVRVYGFEAEAHVKFQHGPHIWAGIACKTCHGEVEKMKTAQPVVRHTMGACLACHRQRKASTDCAACHF